MAVLVRSTASTLGPLRRAMITAGVPVDGARRRTSRSPTSRPSAMLLDVLRCALRTRDADRATWRRRCSSGRSAGRHRVPAAAAPSRCARQFGRRGRPAGAGRAPTQLGAEVLPEYVRWPVRPRGPRARGRPDGRRCRAPTPRHVLWAQLGSHRPGRTAGSRPARQAAPGRSGRPRPRRGGGAVRRGRPLRRPAARCGRRQGSSTTCVASRSPATRCRRPSRRRTRSRSSPRTPARAWSGISSASRACRRAAGRTCAAAARCSAPSSSSTLPGHRAGPARLVRSAARRGTAAVLRRDHAGADPARGDRGRRRATSSRLGSSTSSIRSTASASRSVRRPRGAPAGPGRRAARSGVRPRRGGRRAAGGCRRAGPARGRRRAQAPTRTSGGASHR